MYFTQQSIANGTHWSTCTILPGTLGPCSNPVKHVAPNSLDVLIGNASLVGGELALLCAAIAASVVLLTWRKGRGVSNKDFLSSA